MLMTDANENTWERRWFVLRRCVPAGIASWRFLLKQAFFPRPYLHMYAHSNEVDLKNVFEALLNDSEFLPDGGTLGFYLRHKYPFPHRWESPMPNPLESMQGWLKGSDAALWHASKALGLAPFLRLIHHSYEGSVMLATMVNLGYIHRRWTSCATIMTA